MSDALYGRGLYVFVGLSSNAKSPTSDSTAATWSTKPLPGQRAFETDINGGTKSEFNGAAWVQIDVGGAAKVLRVGQDGNRNPDSVDNNYDATHPELNGSGLLKAVTTLQAVSVGVPAWFSGVVVHTALTGTLTITGLTDIDGTAVNVILPVGFVGTYEAPNGHARCEVALSAQLSLAADAANGNVFLGWRAIN